ncbi:MAG: hypothetical protein R2712_06305 [Vicinamibacterales bacterium]
MPGMAPSQPGQVPGNGARGLAQAPRQVERHRGAEIAERAVGRTLDRHGVAGVVAEAMDLAGEDGAHPAFNASCRGKYHVQVGSLTRP